MSLTRNCRRSLLQWVYREHSLKFIACLRISCHRPEAMKIGASASLSKCFSQEDLDQFAELTGDTNPVHSASSDRPIVHGILTLGLLSAVMGTKLPGPGSKVVDLNVKFIAPLHVGERVQASVEVSDINKRLAVLTLNCRSEDTGQDLITGTTKLLMPKHVTAKP